MTTEKKKRIRPGKLTIDMDEYAIVAHYVTEYHSGNGGNDSDSSGVMKNSKTLISRQEGSKKVRLPKDFVATEVPHLATEVVEKCKYIPSSKLQEVQELMHEMLYQNKARMQDGGGDGNRGMDQGQFGMAKYLFTTT